MQNPFLPNHIGDDTLLPQAISGGTGTRPKAGVAHEFISFFCYSRFRLQLIAIYCNRRWVQTVHLAHTHTSFSSVHNARAEQCVAQHMGSSVCTSASPHPDGHPCRAFECCLTLFLALFLSVCLSCPFFFYLDTDLYLFLHVVDIRATNHWHSTEESGPLAENTPLTV